MDTGNELRQAIKNIRYYTEEIDRLAKQQFNIDFDMGNLVGMEVEPGSKRFNCIGMIETNVEWINVYCNNIEANINHAEELDKELKPKDEESQEEAEIQE